MKKSTTIIFVIIGVIVFGGIYILLQKETKIEKALENEREYPGVSCTPAGQSADEYSFGKYIGPKYCCEGLESISVNTYKDGECLTPTDSGTVCSQCGNGICEEWENLCNCEKDCS